MKKLLTTLLSFLMVFGLVGCGGDTSNQTALEKIKEQGYITFGTSPDYAPSEFYIDDNGTQKLVGTDVYLAEYIAENLGVKLEIQPSDFDSVILNAQAGTIDMGIAGFAYKPDRAEVVDFSINYARANDDSWQGLMIRKEDINKYTSKEKIKELGAIVGAQAGSIQYEMALDIADNANIVQLTSNNDLAAQLSTGDIDAFVCTSSPALGYADTYTNIVLLPKEGFNMDPNNEFDKTGVIFSKDEKYDTLIEEVNKIIEKAQQVDPETGKTLFDVWQEQAEALMPFDMTEKLMEQGTIYNKQ